MSNFINRLKINAPTLLTVTSVISVIGSIAAAIKGTVNAVHAVDEMKESGEEITKKAIIKKVIPYYIPAIGLGVASVTCSFASNHINVKRNRVLKAQNAELVQMAASASTVVSSLASDKRELSKKIADLDPEEKKKQEENKDFIQTCDDTFIFYDVRFGHKFESTYKNFKDAEMWLNSQLYENNFCKGIVTLNELYVRMGGQPDKYIGDKFLWTEYYMSNDWDSCYIYLIETEAYDKSGKKMILFEYTVDPITKDEVNEKEYI